MTDETKNIVKLVRAFMTGVQDIEDVLQQLHALRSVDTATGAQLDVLGRLVGQARTGLDDEPYRRMIRARISANRSKGTIADVLRVADLVVYDDDAYYHALRELNASLHLKIEDVVFGPPGSDGDDVRALAEMVRAARAAGTRVMVEVWPEVETELFVLGGTGTLGDGKVGKGLGWTGDANLGGGLVHVRY